jgi:hypothetical protein
MWVGTITLGNASAIAATATTAALKWRTKNADKKTPTTFLSGNSSG